MERRSTPEPARFDFEPIDFTPADLVDAYARSVLSEIVPKAIRRQVLVRLKGWGLVPSDLDIEAHLEPYGAFAAAVRSAIRAAERHEPRFLAAFGRDPWEFDQAIEGEYEAGEHERLGPRMGELLATLGETVLSVSLRKVPSNDFIVIVNRTDGRRQVVRTVRTDRPLDRLNRDGGDTPPVVPRFEATRLHDGETVLLVEYIDGRQPETPEERARCLACADGLLRVDVDRFDLWAGNFLIESGSGRPYYVDADAVIAIAKRGYRPAVPASRREAFALAKRRFR